MTRLRSPAGWLMSAKERKVFTDVVVILIRIEKRTKKCRKASRESKQEKARDTICLYIKGRGPCFLHFSGALRSLDVVGLKLLYL